MPALHRPTPRRCASALIAAWLATACVSSPDLGSGPDRPATSDEGARRAIASGRIPSISYAILRDGRLDAAATLGVANLETGEPATDSTLYEAASLTKPVVALIALQLVEAGVITLDEPVSLAVPAPRIRDRDRYARVTSRHLLSHSAGLPNWSGDSLDAERTDSLEFAFEPGSDFSYSGEGYVLLGEFLERKSGRSLVDLSDALFSSLGMHSSSLVGARLDGRAARGHFGRSPDRKARLLDRPVPAYSLVTNAADYGRFLAFVANGAGLDPATLAESRRIQIPMRPTCLRRLHASEQMGWSLGWGVLVRSNDVVFFQWGDNGAFRAFAAYAVEQGALPNGLVFFVNGSRGLLEADALAAPVLGDISTATRSFNSPTLEVLRALLRF